MFMVVPMRTKHGASTVPQNQHAQCERGASPFACLPADPSARLDIITKSCYNADILRTLWGKVIKDAGIVDRFIAQMFLIVLLML